MILFKILKQNCNNILLKNLLNAMVCHCGCIASMAPNIWQDIPRLCQADQNMLNTVLTNQIVDFWNGSIRSLITKQTTAKIIKSFSLVNVVYLVNYRIFPCRLTVFCNKTIEIIKRLLRYVYINLSSSNISIRLIKILYLE